MIGNAVHLLQSALDITELVSFSGVITAQLLLWRSFDRQGLDYYQILLKNGSRREKAGVTLMIICFPVLISASVVMFFAYSK